MLNMIRIDKIEHAITEEDLVSGDLKDNVKLLEKSALQGRIKW